MPEATTWDLWYGGLLREGTPEPPGRRSPAELAALEVEGAGNFAHACPVLEARTDADRRAAERP